MRSNNICNGFMMVLTCLPITLIVNAIYGQNIPRVTAKQDSDWQTDLKFALTALEQNYAYPLESDLDWKMIRKSYLGRLKQVKNGQEFFSLVEELAEEPHDHHLHLNQNSQESYRLVPTSLELWVEFENGVYKIKSVREFSQNESSGPMPGGIIEKIDGEDFDDAVKKRLAPYRDRTTDTAKSWAARTLIAGRQSQDSIELTVSNSKRVLTKHELKLGGTQTRTGLLSHRQLSGNVHYVRIENSLGQSELVSEFDELVDGFRDDQSMILDLRNTPSGGNTLVARGIMGRLVSKEMPYQRHELVEQPFNIPRIWVEQVAPRGRDQFDGKIIVLVGRWTGSMGEGITIGLDSMNRATTVGTPMAGLKGATRRFDLPNSGIGIYIPTERLFHIDGTPREDFRPNMEIDAQTSNDYPALAKALKLLAN